MEVSDETLRKTMTNKCCSWTVHFSYYQKNIIYHIAHCC